MSDEPRHRFPTMEVSDPAFERDGLRHVTVFSRALGRRADCSVWTPADSAGVDLPLVVLLHGVYGSHWGWAASGGAHVIAARLVATGAVAPFALAMPSDGLFAHGSGYLRHRGGDFATWILDDVPALVAALVPGVAANRSFALGGLSMGGFGALVLGASHPHRVHAVAALSAITDFEQMRLFVGDIDAYDVANEERNAAAVWTRCASPPRLLLACGATDPLIEHNRTLHGQLETAGVAHRWVEDDGGHEWTYWRDHAEMAIRFALGA